MRTCAVDGAARSMRANTARIATEVPTIPWSSLRDESGRRVESPRSSKRSVTRPRRRRLPARGQPSITCTPSRIVPLRLPRSRTRTFDSPTRTSQWKRDTVGSSTVRSFDGCEPIEQRSPGATQVVPAFGPSTIVIWNPGTIATCAPGPKGSVPPISSIVASVPPR
jgi:hypothetical protein